MTARALVVQNSPNGGPRRFGAWLAEDGLSLDVVHGYAGSPVPARLSHQAVVVLGGGFMPDDFDRAPWLRGTRALVTQALEAEVPVFGICLGGQLLAQAAGGTVRADHGAPEAGSTRLTARAEADGDALFGGLPGPLTAIENHVDAITALPPGAHWLLESERCPYQAFRCGAVAWGVQFHPEATAAQIGGWSRERLRRLGFDPEELRRTAERDEPAAAPVWRTVARRFAALVRGA